MHDHHVNIIFHFRRCFELFTKNWPSCRVQPKNQHSFNIFSHFFAPTHIRGSLFFTTNWNEKITEVSKFARISRVSIPSQRNKSADLSFIPLIFTIIHARTARRFLPSFQAFRLMLFELPVKPRKWNNFWGKLDVRVKMTKERFWWRFFSTFFPQKLFIPVLKAKFVIFILPPANMQRFFQLYLFYTPFSPRFLCWGITVTLKQQKQDYKLNPAPDLNFPRLMYNGHLLIQTQEIWNEKRFIF